MSTFYAEYPVEGAGSNVVTSLNGETGAITILAGSGITVTPSGSDITIASTGGGTVTSVGSGTGLTGGPITTSGTLSIANTAVTPGSYTAANITVNQQGQITAASNGASGASPTRQVLTSSGTYTTPAGATFLKVTIVGDGAGGGGAPTPGAGNSCGGGGGGAGAICIVWITSPAASYPYVIGTGGTGGTGSATGLAGTGSWFAGSSTYVAGGGAAGPSGGVAPFVTPSTGNALGGVATGGDVNLNGGDGGCGFCFSPNNGLGGYGGSNQFSGQVAGQSSITNGAHGYPFGGGGSGASNVGNSGMDTTGGNGAAGIIIVEEYYA